MRRCCWPTMLPSSSSFFIIIWPRCASFFDIWPDCSRSSRSRSWPASAAPDRASRSSSCPRGSASCARGLAGRAAGSAGRAPRAGSGSCVLGELLDVLAQRVAQLLHQVVDLGIGRTLLQSLGELVLRLAQRALGIGQIAVLDAQRELPQPVGDALDRLARVLAPERMVDGAQAEIDSRISSMKPLGSSVRASSARST